MCDTMETMERCLEVDRYMEKHGVLKFRLCPFQRRGFLDLLNVSASVSTMSESVISSAKLLHAARTMIKLKIQDVTLENARVNKCLSPTSAEMISRLDERRSCVNMLEMWKDTIVW